jgi:tetratricopeptide (TPR) repeat protein
LDKILQEANLNIKRGRLNDAHELYDRALSIASNESMEQLNLGNTGVWNDDDLSQSFFEQLSNSYHKADYQKVIDKAQIILEMYPSSYVIWNVFGAASAKLGLIDQALSAFKNVIKLRPDFLDGNINLAMALQENGLLREASNAYERVLEIEPDNFEACLNLANIFYYQEKFVEAEKLYAVIISLEPRYADAYDKLGSILQCQGRLVEASHVCKSLIEVNPLDPNSHNTLGAIFIARNMPEDAINSFNTAIELEPDFPEAHNNLGAILAEQGSVEQAISAHEIAVSLKPDYAEAHFNLGIAFRKLDRLDKAVNAYKHALSIKPDYAKANYNLGRLNWLQNNFESAFELMEWRWQGEPECIGTQFDGNRPTWDGDASEAVFVWREQGIGDEIMFGSMLPALHAISSKVILECDQRLIPIYERSFPEGIRFVSHRNQVSEDEYTSHIAVGSLLKHFRRKLEDFSSVSPGWLKAEPKKIASLRERLRSKASDKVIGISWQTNATGTKSYQRNIPLDILAKYLKPVQAKFVNLQYDSTTDVLLNAEKSTGLKIDNIDEIDIYNDIDGLAALISACDIVVSIDNSTVHLAGALGIDTRVLLPEVADERWGLDSSDSYWYDHLTLYRQISKDDWSNPLECLVQDLNQELS